MKILFERIKALCAERNLSINALEKAAGLPSCTVYRWGVKTPSVDKVAKVAAALGVTVDDLLREDADAGE